MILVEFEILLVRSDLANLIGQNDTSRTRKSQPPTFQEPVWHKCNKSGQKTGIWKSSHPAHYCSLLESFMNDTMSRSSVTTGKKKKMQWVTLKTPAHQGNQGRLDYPLVIMLASTWGQLTGQASPKSTKDQNQRSPIHRLVLEMQKLRKGQELHECRNKMTHRGRVDEKYKTHFNHLKQSVYRNRALSYKEGIVSCEVTRHKLSQILMGPNVPPSCL